MDKIKDNIEYVNNLNSLSGDEYQRKVIDLYGYDPKEELRINKLEKMVRFMSSSMKRTINRRMGNMDKEHIEIFDGVVGNVKPLLFKMVEGFRDTVIDMESIGDIPIDIPFQTFSIEPADDWHGLYTMKDNNVMLNATMILAHELSPEKLLLFTLYNYISNNNFIEYVESSIFTFSKDEKLYPALATYLNRLDNRTAKVPYKARTKVKRDSQKKYFKYNSEAIYIDVAKKYESRNFGNYPIEWSISWEVRGHWRRFNGIGKNRQGVRNVEGFTWVVPHVKGDGELSNKKRVVK